MSTTGEWTVEEREPGWLGRLIAPQGGGRPATAAFLLGVLAAGAFVGSLALDWQSVTIPANGPVTEVPTDQHIASGVASIETLSLVHTLGVVALLGLAGAVVTRPELALRLRMAAAGATVGLLGVLTAITVRLSDSIASFPVAYFGYSTEQVEQLAIAYEPGIICGYAAVLLSAAAVWIAGRPAARALAAARTGPAAGRAMDDAVDPAAEPVEGAPDVWSDAVGGLSVLPSEPLRFPPR